MSKTKITIPAWMVIASCLIILAAFFLFMVSMSGCATNTDPVRRALEKSAIGLKEIKETWGEIRKINLMELQEKTLDECIDKNLTQSECKNLYFERAQVYYAIGESIDAAHLLLEMIERGYDAVQAGRTSNYAEMIHAVSECLWHVEFIMRKFDEIGEETPYAIQEIRKYLSIVEGELR